MEMGMLKCEKGDRCVDYLKRCLEVPLLVPFASRAHARRILLRVASLRTKPNNNKSRGSDKSGATDKEMGEGTHIRWSD